MDGLRPMSNRDLKYCVSNRKSMGFYLRFHLEFVLQIAIRLVGTHFVGAKLFLHTSWIVVLLSYCAHVHWYFYNWDLKYCVSVEKI
jgi:hypothetical protein